MSISRAQIYMKLCKQAHSTPCIYLCLFWCAKYHQSQQCFQHFFAGLPWTGHHPHPPDSMKNKGSLTKHTKARTWNNPVDPTIKNKYKWIKTTRLLLTTQTILQPTVNLLKTLQYYILPGNKSHTNSNFISFSSDSTKSQPCPYQMAHAFESFAQLSKEMYISIMLIWKKNQTYKTKNFSHTLYHPLENIQKMSL